MKNNLGKYSKLFFRPINPDQKGRLSSYFFSSFSRKAYRDSSVNVPRLAQYAGDERACIMIFWILLESAGVALLYSILRLALQRDYTSWSQRRDNCAFTLSLRRKFAILTGSEQLQAWEDPLGVSPSKLIVVVRGSSMILLRTHCRQNENG